MDAEITKELTESLIKSFLFTPHRCFIPSKNPLDPHYLRAYKLQHYKIHFWAWFWEQLSDFIQEMHDMTIDLGAYCNHEDCGYG